MSVVDSVTKTYRLCRLANLAHLGGHGGKLLRIPARS
jgi:hypothetical protein